MDIEEVKNELTKEVMEAHSDYVVDPVDEGYADGYATGCRHALDLLENLQEKKVVVPQYVADLIGDCIFDNVFDVVRSVCRDSKFEYGSNLDEAHERTQTWLKKGHLHDLISAWENGYEIKEPKYRVKVDDKLYFQRFNCTEAVFLIDDSLGAKESSPVFTRKEGNKLLETLGVESGRLEEVEDDD